MYTVKIDSIIWDIIFISKNQTLKNNYLKFAIDYPIWLDDVSDGLSVNKAYVIGSSMGDG